MPRDLKLDILLQTAEKAATFEKLREQVNQSSQSLAKKLKTFSGSVLFL